MTFGFQNVFERKIYVNSQQIPSLFLDFCDYNILSYSGQSKSFLFEIMFVLIIKWILH